MGHMMKRTLVRVKEALAAASPDRPDGCLLYGEGWDFGEVFGGARGPNASAVRMSGTGVGCFNDRCVSRVAGLVWTYLYICVVIVLDFLFIVTAVIGSYGYRIAISAVFI
jgi:hypothetical protein